MEKDLDPTLDESRKAFTKRRIRLTILKNEFQKYANIEKNELQHLNILLGLELNFKIYFKLFLKISLHHLLEVYSIPQSFYYS